MNPKDIFKSTAPYYSRYRPQYPDELFRRVAEVFDLDGSGRLLDLGCGPGHLTLPFSQYFQEVVGLDPNPEMLAEAQRVANDRDVSNATWIEACAEDIGPGMGVFRLTSMGHSFHWMKQELVLERLHSIVVPGGGAIVVDDLRRSATPDFAPVVQAVKKRYLGERRRAGGGYYRPPAETYETYFARSSFRPGEPILVQDDWTRTIDWIVGNCYSHSSCSPYVLGEMKDRFERDLRRELLDLNASGEFRGVTEIRAYVLFRD